MITPSFVLAGRAVFTVDNGKGQHYTFKVSHKAAEGSWPEAWFASLLTGPDNTSDYTYLGMINPDLTVKLTRKSPYGPDSQPVKVLGWALRRIVAQSLPEGYNVHHEGKCGRCGRVLTVPASITSGFGPECIGKIGGLSL
jgi:hypothetical protein